MLNDKNICEKSSVAIADQAASKRENTEKLARKNREKAEPIIYYINNNNNMPENKNIREKSFCCSCRSGGTGV
jgi:hypothetical protein